MRGRTIAVMVSTVIASLVGAAASTAATHAPRCDARPIDTALTALERIGVPGISVTVKTPRCGMWSGGIGVADLATGRKVVGDEHSRIASDTKTWVSTVVLQLVAEGRMKLDATVDDYLPGLIRNRRYDGRKITIRELLQHTGGLPDYLDAPYWNNEDGHRWTHIDPLWTVKQALRLPPPHRNRSGFYYSNTDYNLLGLIVTRVTGRSIATELYQRIIKPLGLRQTYWPGDQTTIRKPVLHTYERHDGRLVDMTDWNVSEANASGELISTGPDATTFWTALMSGKLLPRAQLAEMRQHTVPDDEPYGERYGLGVERYQFGPHFVAWGHSGLMEGGATFRNAVTNDGRRAVTLLIDRQLSDAESNRIQLILGKLLRDLR